MDKPENPAQAPLQPLVTPFSEGRVKIISINQDFLVKVLNWWRNPPHWMALPITDELPEDCVVVSISVCWERRCIEALVASREFPVCLRGALVVRIPGVLDEMRIVPFESV